MFSLLSKAFRSKEEEVKETCPAVKDDVYTPEPDTIFDEEEHFFKIFNRKVYLPVRTLAFSREAADALMEDDEFEPFDGTPSTQDLYQLVEEYGRRSGITANGHTKYGMLFYNGGEDYYRIAYTANDFMRLNADPCFELIEKIETYNGIHDSIKSFITPEPVQPEVVLQTDAVIDEELASILINNYSDVGSLNLDILLRNTIDYRERHPEAKILGVITPEDIHLNQLHLADIPNVGEYQSYIHLPIHNYYTKEDSIIIVAYTLMILNELDGVLYIVDGVGVRPDTDSTQILDYILETYNYPRLFALSTNAQLKFDITSSPIMNPIRSKGHLDKSLFDESVRVMTDDIVHETIRKCIRKIKGNNHINVFLSQPMTGLTDEQIAKRKEYLMNKVYEVVAAEKVIEDTGDIGPSEVTDPMEKFIEFYTNYSADGEAPMDSFHTNHKSLIYNISRAITALIDKDLVAFPSDWILSNGCIIEFIVATNFGIPVVMFDIESDPIPKVIDSLNDIWNNKELYTSDSVGIESEV